jgi:hypothetical protein
MLLPATKAQSEQPQYPPVVSYNGRLYQFESQIEWFLAAVEACSRGQDWPPLPTKRPIGDKLVPIREAAARLGVGRRTVGRRIKDAEAAAEAADHVAAE